jgi:hypothetical protein
LTDLHAVRVGGKPPPTVAALKAALRKAPDTVQLEGPDLTGKATKLQQPVWADVAGVPRLIYRGTTGKLRVARGSNVEQVAGLSRHDQAKLDEKAAKQQHRHVQQMRAGRARSDAQRRREAMALVMARKRAEKCSCDFTVDATPEHLRSLGAGCTAGAGYKQRGWVCPVLDAARRAVKSPGRFLGESKED